MSDSFVCARCGGTFTKGWTDAEAQAEYETVMPEAAARGDETDVICDDCFNEFLPWFAALTEEQR